MRDSFVCPFTIIKLIGKIAAEFKLTEEFSRKHPVIPVSLVKPYAQTEEGEPHTTRKSGGGEFPWNSEENHWARKIRLNGRDQRQYFFRCKNQTADKDKWLAEDAIPDGNFHFRRFRASRRTE
ncbi:hypothetical protein O181_070056 [Austropuccinia psidii MF-1]|uniref:Uncharacterized protein n=1 Tax=Austropuccinia psidii MF-1 TaxID=1389203 RepID=A0A9Q3EXZ7_9BASI|nr:hypothetical protein [Austropuccinia psidii MF-1]